MRTRLPPVARSVFTAILQTITVLLFSLSAHADGPHVNLADPSVGMRRDGTNLIVEVPGQKTLSIPIYHLKPGTEVYSYTSQGNVDRWHHQGYIDPGELDHYRAGSDGMDVGGGLYVAKEPISTRMYGDGKFVVFEMKSDIPILDLSSHHYKNFVWNAAVTERLRNNGVLGIGNFEKNQWISLIHPWSVSKVRKGTTHDYYRYGPLRDGNISDEDLLAIHQKYPLLPDPQLEQTYPAASKTLRDRLLKIDPSCLTQFRKIFH